MYLEIRLVESFPHWGTEMINMFRNCSVTITFFVVMSNYNRILVFYEVFLKMDFTCFSMVLFLLTYFL